MNRTAVLLTALALGAFPAGAALAQLAPASNAPIDVTADQLLAQNQQCVATWKGAVEARQGTSRLRADTLSIYEKVGAGPSQGQGASLGAATGKCGSDPEKLVADGSVYYATPQEVVKGDHAVYLAETKTITVTGDVVISQGKNVIVGNTLVINTDTGQATMESTAKGRGAPGRVRAVIFPSSTQSGGLIPSTPARP
ncbi:MAG TPA: LptA/OstA family protein [Caulobacteraceae bacterium]|jgi:lipopolysaccharide export system protein LptA|nr:LptA/OstA family protein [Caulobacteraceae bacterium]